MDIYLELAECLIHIHEPTNRHVIFWPDPPWDQFERAPYRSPDIQIEVTVVNRLPEIPHGEVLFDANHGSWKLCDAGDNYYFESLHTLKQFPYRRALISKDYSRATVYAATTRFRNRVGWTPAQVVNPIAEFCLLTWLAKRGALMLHASGVVMESGAWVFSGPSGAGKSTIAELFAGRALNRLSDETILIRKSDEGFTAYGTPWLGSGRIAASDKAPLAYLFFIRHGQERHEIHTAPVQKLSRFLFQQAFLPHWDKPAMEKTAEVFQEIAQQGFAYDLAFLNSPDVVDFLEAHDKALA